MASPELSCRASRLPVNPKCDAQRAVVMKILNRRKIMHKKIIGRKTGICFLINSEIHDQSVNAPNNTGP